MLKHLILPTFKVLPHPAPPPPPSGWIKLAGSSMTWVRQSSQEFVGKIKPYPAIDTLVLFDVTSQGGQGLSVPPQLANWLQQASIQLQARHLACGKLDTKT